MSTGTANTSPVLKYRFIGTTDSVTTCDCCGRTGLKVTVCIHNEETGDELYFGTSCAAKALRIPSKEVTAGAKAADRAREEAERAQRDAEHRAHMIRWTNHLVARTGGRFPATEIFQMIRDLGGMAAARQGFAE